MLARAAILLAAALLACAQSVVPADSARAAFDSPPSGSVRCQFSSTPPALNYALGFETAFAFSLPVSELRDPARHWSLLLRVTPENSNPVYLLLDNPKSETLENNSSAKFEGKFAVGEGSYEASALLRDRGATVCQHAWSIHAKPDSPDPLIFAPNQVLGLDDVAPSSPKPVDPKLDRLTILVHAAAFTPGHAQLTHEEVQYLTEAVGSVLDRLPASHTRLLVFNLNQTAPLYESDGFTISALPEVSKAIENSQFAVVNYRALRPGAPIERVTDLLRSETVRSDPPSAIIFIGPEIQLPENASETVPKSASAGAAQIFYLQFCQYRKREESLPDPKPFHSATRPIDGLGTFTPMPPLKRPDPIARILKALKFDVISIYRPIEFLAALRRIQSRIAPPSR